MLDSTIERYTIQDIQTIEKTCIRVPLNASVLTMIQNIYNEVCSKPRMHVNNSKETKSIQKSFKTTPMTTRSGIDVSIDTIRKLLNMCTDTTYDQLYPKLIHELNVIQNEHYNLDDLDKLNNIMFHILSSVMVYSKLYATLYSKVYHTYDFLQDTITDRVACFRESILQIQYHNSTNEYEQFCKNNKDNLKRRTTGAFFVHLIPYGIVNVVEINTILLFIQNEILKRICIQNQTEIVDELTELESILYLTGQTYIHISDEWTELQDNLKHIASLKPKEYVSLSAKSIFQHMDMVDSINGV